MFFVFIIALGGMIARRLDEAMAKHNARNQQGVEQDCIYLLRMVEIIMTRLLLN